MHLIDARGSRVSAAPVPQSRSRHPSRTRHGGATDGTYDLSVPASASQDPRVLAFARFVKRALGEARAEGWSIDDVEERTGLRRSTIYRWTRAEVESPQRIQVHKFVDGLGIPRTTASQILGWDGTPRPPTLTSPSTRTCRPSCDG
ncbi:helix-turn-helix domain-containing protein [Micromonospora zhanjiangensis]